MTPQWTRRECNWILVAKASALIVLTSNDPAQAERCLTVDLKDVANGVQKQTIFQKGRSKSDKNLTGLGQNRNGRAQHHGLGHQLADLACLSTIILKKSLVVATQVKQNAVP